MENVDKLKIFIKNFDKDSRLMVSLIKKLIIKKEWATAVFNLIEEGTVIKEEILRKEIVTTFIENVEFEEIKLPYWVLRTATFILTDDVDKLLATNDKQVLNNTGAWLSYMYSKY